MTLYLSLLTRFGSQPVQCSEGNSLAKHLDLMPFLLSAPDRFKLLIQILPQ